MCPCAHASDTPAVCRGAWLLVALDITPPALSAHVVPASDEAVPSPRGPSVPDQHLPGGWHPHVVPVERAEGLH